MTYQYLLVALILAAAVAYAVCRIFRSFRSAGDPCHGCEGCQLKSLRKGIQTEICEKTRRNKKKRQKHLAVTFLFLTFAPAFPQYLVP